MLCRSLSTPFYKLPISYSFIFSRACSTASQGTVVTPVAVSVRQKHHLQVLGSPHPRISRPKTLQEVMDRRLLRIGRLALETFHNGALLLSEVSTRYPEIRPHLERLPKLNASDQEILEWYRNLALEMPLHEEMATANITR